jgi:hypothetical protein
MGYQQAPIASNPANGVNNIPLTGGAGAQAGQGVSSGMAGANGGGDGAVQPEELLDVLRKIQNAPMSQAQQFQGEVEGLLNRSQNPQIQQQLQRLLHAMVMTSDPRQQTVDPASGKKDPTAADIARKLYEEIKQMTSQQKPPQQQAQQQTASAIRVSLVRVAQQKPKKKTRGNPFRVLMGKVGKLLDHGLEKSTIVREIKKRINFDEDTIARAVDIVKDYNKSKRRNDRAEEAADGGKSEKKSSTVFNAARWAATQRDGKDGSESGVYDVKPDFAKRSTAELIARKSWLEDLRDMGKNAASQSGVASELKSINAALKARGFDESEL